MTFAQAVKLYFFKHLFTIRARSCALEYWFGIAMSLILFLCLLISTYIMIIMLAFSTDSASADSMVTALGIVVLFVGLSLLIWFYIAFVTATIRRLHDVKKSSAFVILCLVPNPLSLITLLLCTLSSVDEGNNYAYSRHYTKDSLASQQKSKVSAFKQEQEIYQQGFKDGYAQAMQECKAQAKDIS